MKLFTTNQKKSIQMLSIGAMPDIVALRDKMKILVIDNEEFPLLETFRSNNFKIDHIDDLETYNYLEGYSIILCDIDGVGKKLGFSDGFGLIKEIKNRLPLKAVICFSAIKHDIRRSRLNMIADAVREKDDSFELWCDNLNQTMKNFSDPIFLWKYARRKMLEANENIHIVAELEDLFVKHCEEKNPKNFIREKNITTSSDTIKSIANSLIANFIFHYLSNG